jgi:hypothetical protein
LVLLQSINLKAELLWLDILVVLLLFADGFGEVSLPGEVEDEHAEVVEGRNNGSDISVYACHLIIRVVS